MPIHWDKLTIANFKEGLHKVTPLQLCQARILGYYGTLAGIILTMIPMFLGRQWGWLVFIFFVGWLQCAALLGDIQQRKVLIESEADIKRALEQLKNIEGQSEVK